jgi:hypothetical protein
MRQQWQFSWLRGFERQNPAKAGKSGGGQHTQAPRMTEKTENRTDALRGEVARARRPS